MRVRHGRRRVEAVVLRAAGAGYRGVGVAALQRGDAEEHGAGTGGLLRLHDREVLLNEEEMEEGGVSGNGWAGFQLGRGGGVDTALWLDPRQKKAQLTAPQNPTEADPRADAGAKFWQKMKMRLLESARRGGSEKSSFARYLVKKIQHFQCSKFISAPEFIITD